MEQTEKNVILNYLLERLYEATEEESFDIENHIKWHEKVESEGHPRDWKQFYITSLQQKHIHANNLLCRIIDIQKLLNDSD